jgi:hypothetical protein
MIDKNEQCFKENSKSYNCLVSSMCAKEISDCIEKKKLIKPDLKNHYASCLLSQHNVYLEKCVNKLFLFLEEDYLDKNDEV